MVGAIAVGGQGAAKIRCSEGRDAVLDTQLNSRLVKRVHGEI